MENVLKTNAYSPSFEESREFKKNYVMKNLWYQRILIFIAIIIYIGLGYFHAGENPHLAKYIYIIRLGIVAPVALLIIIFSFFKIYEKIAGFLFSVGIIAAGSGVIVLIKYCDDSAKYYFLTGLVLIVFMNYTLKILLPWAFLSGAGIAVVFNFSDFIFKIDNAANIGNTLSSSDYIYINIYLITANILGAYLAFVFELYEKKDFFFKRNLEMEKFRIGSLNKDLETAVKKNEYDLIEKNIQLKTFYEEKKTIEKELKNKSNEYLNLIATMDDACFEINKTGKIILLNPGLSNLLETDYSRIKDRSLFDFLDEESIRSVKRKMQKFFEVKDKTLRIDFKIICLNSEKTKKHVEASVTKKFSSKGKLTGFLGIVRDVTQRHKFEKELEKADRIKSFFLENINHELRTPLNGMTGFTHMLISSEELSPEDRKKAVMIKSSLDHMSFLINDLLDFSKIYADEMVVENEKFLFSDLIERIKKQCKRYSFSSDFDIIFNKDQKISNSYIGDIKLISNSIGSLVETALRFWGPENLIMDAFCTSNENGIDLIKINIKTQSLKDENSGLPCFMDQGLDFDKDFDCADKSDFLFSVAGMMIEKIGGRVLTAYDGHKNGFSVEIPLEKDSFEISEKRKDDKEQLIADKNILIVEDNKVNQMVLQAILKKEGANIYLAADGKKGIDLLLNTDIDLVLMDIQMPVMDGITAAQKIRAGEAGELKKNIPVIAVTAHAVKADKTRCLSAGMDDYLTKPVKPDVLKAAIVKNLFKGAVNE